MANFHSNLLAIAANEADMCKVLFRMAMNLAANEEHTGFNMRDIAEIETAKDLYYVVGPAVEASYIFAFAGAPIAVSGDGGETFGWTSPTSSEGGFLAQLQAMAQVAKRFNEKAAGDTSLSLSSVAPVGRAMSESAVVGLARYGENWLLEVCYDTAWSPNSEDIDVFFRGLPKGSYGVAFYDADEYDQYETVSAFSGLHNGCATLHSVSTLNEWTTLEKAELQTRRRAWRNVPKSSISDLGELAKASADCYVNTCGWDEEEEEAESRGLGDDCELVSLSDRFAIEWGSPKQSDLRKIEKLLFDAIGSFPWVHQPDFRYTPERSEAVERLFPGDFLTVVSSWGSRDDPGEVTFSVLDQKGNIVGKMGYWMRLFEDWSAQEHSSAVLACLLPHLRATVWSLVPGSLRSKGVDEPVMSIRFELEPVNIGDLVAEAHALLEKAPGERTLSSKGGR